MKPSQVIKPTLPKELDPQISFAQLSTQVFIARTCRIWKAWGGPRWLTSGMVPVFGCGSLLEIAPCWGRFGRECDRRIDVLSTLRTNLRRSSPEVLCSNTPTRSSSREVRKRVPTFFCSPFPQAPLGDLVCQAGKLFHGFFLPERPADFFGLPATRGQMSGYG